MSCSLWHMDSLVLQGFYKSEVNVAARSREDAIQEGLRAYDRWIEGEIHDYGFHRLISDSFPGEEGYEEQSKAKRIEFHEELRTRLQQQTHRGLIEVAS